MAIAKADQTRVVTRRSLAARELSTKRDQMGSAAAKSTTASTAQPTRFQPSARVTMPAAATASAATSQPAHEGSRGCDRDRCLTVPVFVSVEVLAVSPMSSRSFRPWLVRMSAIKRSSPASRRWRGPRS